MLNIPISIIRYEEEVFETLDWAEESGFIDKTQKETLIDNIKDIKYKLYPEEK